METKFDDIGNRIAEFGKSLCGSGRGWQTEFGRRLDMSPQAVATYLKGYRNPGMLVYEKLEKLGADIYYIRTGRRRSDEPIDKDSRAAEIARRSREEAMHDGIDESMVIIEDVCFHIENARTPQQRARLPYWRMVRAILTEMKATEAD